MLELKVCCTGRYMSADTIAGVKQRGVQRLGIANSSDGPPNAHGKSHKDRKPNSCQKTRPCVVML